MRTLRLSFRLFALSLGTGFIYLLWFLVWPIGWALGRPLEWRSFVFRRWGLWVARVLGARIEVRGRPPQPPFFLVSNHLSYFDIPLLATQLSCVFLSKADVARWPVIGFLARSMGTLFIRREKKRDVRRVVSQIERCLKRGMGVVVFPEATSTGGDTVIPFRSSMLQPAATAGLAVHYVALHYSTPPGLPPARDVVCWWGGMTFGRHVLELMRLPGFDARIEFGAEPILAGDRKLLAESLHRAVLAQFTRLREALG